ncbi:MAG TPA: SDR family NAD(P)-dependent oxidoreductase [Candidatus Peribacteraceae bacterium]|nr:SDR family NAD(P)-dependent oxidoreductase [Candidatus Peribacteraceae bacterium]
MRICVIGASKGVGRALARELASRGHSVWAAARSSNLDTSSMGPIRWSTVDIRDVASVTAWQSDMERSDWSPDIVVIASGILLNDMERAYDSARGRDVLQTNLEGPLTCVEVFLPLFLKRGSGSFVALCSTSALRPSLRSASYSASKAGLAMAWRSLGLRFDRQGIRFALATLGPIATDMWEGRKSPLVPTPERAASRLAAFVVSSKSNFFYPLFSTFLLRFSLLLPNRMFAILAEWALKR